MLDGPGGPAAIAARSARRGSARVALDGGAEVGSREGAAGEAPLGPRPGGVVGPRPTGAAAGRRQRLPAGRRGVVDRRPARSRQDPSAETGTRPYSPSVAKSIARSTPLRSPLAEVDAPVEHEAQGRRGAGRNIRSARELAQRVIARGGRSCGRPARRRPARWPAPRSTRPRERRRRRHPPAGLALGGRLDLPDVGAGLVGRGERARRPRRPR